MARLRAGEISEAAAAFALGAIRAPPTARLAELDDPAGACLGGG